MKKNIFVKIILLSVLIMCIFSCLIINLRKMYFTYKEKEALQNVENILQEEKNEKDQEKQNINKNGEIGLIIIPSLDIKAPIYEGTSSDVLKYSVGHFKETNLWEGNIVLASHNRGSYAHYFSEINKLKNGEEIIYITNMGERRYEVLENKIIDETNVEILQNTKENIITLVTCVTNQKSKRQCIVGKEIY